MQLKHSKCSKNNYHVSQRFYYENVHCSPSSRGYHSSHFLKILAFLNNNNNNKNPQHPLIVYMKYCRTECNHHSIPMYSIFPNVLVAISITTPYNWNRLCTESWGRAYISKSYDPPKWDFLFKNPTQEAKTNSPFHDNPSSSFSPAGIKNHWFKLSPLLTYTLRPMKCRLQQQLWETQWKKENNCIQGFFLISKYSILKSKSQISVYTNNEL